SRILGLTLMLANRLLGTEIPARIENEMSDDHEAAKLGDEIQSQLAGNSTPNTESLAYFRMTMRLRERPTDRIRFLQRLVFTPGPREWSAVKLPEPLFPLYRLVRLGRLSARLLRA